jgi:hypothetical protein
MLLWAGTFRTRRPSKPAILTAILGEKFAA